MKTGVLALLTLALALPAQETDGGKGITHVDKPPAKRRPGAPVGLLLTFHGANGNAGSLVGKAEEMLQKAGVRDDFVVIGLKSKEAGWTDKDDAPVKAFIPWAVKTYAVDARRVYGLGVSSGAWYLNRFAPAHSELLAGAVSYVGGMGRPPASEAPRSHAELYWVIGHKDDTLPPSRTRPAAEAFFKAGFRAVYREMFDHAHEGPKDPTQEEAVHWMRALRNKRVAPAADDLEFLKKFEDPARSASALTAPGTWVRLAAIGGPQAAPAVLQGLANERSGVRTMAVQACTQVMFDDKVVDALAALLEDKDTKVRRTALAALAFQGKWNYAQAQAALCAVARDEQRPEGDRRAAAQGLAEIVRIDLLGTFLYRECVWTLVELLGDRDGVLRQTAFQALQPVQADGFGYQPSLPDAPRSKAHQRWREWCEKTCGPRGA
jgi:dienelactone hydrolase